MEEKHRPPLYYALLIGIDTYQEKPLQGAARDVREIRRLLEKLYPSMDITSLVAGHSNGVTIQIEGLPTWTKVTGAIKDLLTKVASGDRVYIHFSGHGSCWERNRSVLNTPANVQSWGNQYRSEKPRSFDDFGSILPQRGPLNDHKLSSSNVSTNDLALNLLANDKTGEIEYLYGYDLASALKLMVDQGALVTLALDCCYSGSVVRDDDFRGVSRYLNLQDEIAERSRRMDLPQIEPLLGSTWRDSSMLPNWIINPSGYSILTACGAQEKAYEVSIDTLRTQDLEKELKEADSHPTSSRPKQGIFSFYLTDALSKLGTGRISQQHFSLQLRALLRARKIPQNPTFYGTANAFFFGDSSRDVGEPHSYPVIKELNGRVRLLAGEAHGLADDDTVLLHSAPSVMHYEIQSRISKVQPLTSILEVESIVESHKIETGMQGSIIHDRSIQVIFTYLADDLPLLNDVKHSLAKRKPLQESISSQPPFMCISQILQGQLEIANKETTHKIRMKLNPSRNVGVEQIVDLIEHLERYETTKRLAPKTLHDSFCKTHVVKAKAPNRVWIQPSGKEVVTSGEMVAFEIRNKSEQTCLYAHVYGWGPLYQVTNNLSGSYIAIPPKSPQKGLPGFARFQVQLALPQALRGLGQVQCRDTLKIIVTSHPTDFQHLIMPALMESSGEFATDVAVPATRGDDEVSGSEMQESWATYDFFIDTVASNH